MTNNNGIHKKTSNAIHRYLKYNDQLALQINGPWGTGKTYYIKHTIFRKMRHENYGKKYIPIYVSLNGINTLSNLRQQLGLNLISNSFDQSNDYIKLGLTILSLFGNGLNTLFENNKYLKILKGLNINPEQIGEKIRTTLLNHKNNVVLVFDDLERSDLSLSVIFGFISNLIYRFHCKILIISNESGCKGPNKLLLRERKEKIISKTIQFGNDSWRVALNILESNLKDNDYMKPWILSISIYILKHMKSNINLRALLSIITDYKALFTNIKEMHVSNKIKNKSLKVGYLTIFTLTDIIKKNQLPYKNKDRKRFLNSFFYRTGYNLKVNANHEKIFRKSYLYKMFFKNYNHKFLKNIYYTKDIYLLVTEDICSFKSFVKQIKITFFNNESIINRELMFLTQWGTRFTDQYISQINTKLYSAIKLLNWSCINLKSWIKYYSLLIKLSHQGFLFNFHDSLLYKIKDYIINKAKHISLIKLDEINPNNLNSNIEPNLRGELIKIYNKRAQNKVSYYAKWYLTGLFYNGPSENGMINYPKFRNIFMHNSFCKIILDDKDIQNKLTNKCHPAFVVNFNKYIQNEMKDQHLYQRHHIELKYLKALIIFLNNAKSKTNSHVLTFDLVTLIKSMKQFRDKLHHLNNYKELK